MTNPPTVEPVVVRVDRPSAIYHVGESVGFSVRAGEETAPLAYALTWDGVEDIEKGSLSLKGRTGSVTFRPCRPGFARLAITDQTGTVVGQAAAAIDPDQIPPSLPAPHDFDAFWEGKSAPQRAAPSQSTMRLHTERPEASIHTVEIPMPDSTMVYGWLLRPNEQGPFPAIVLYHGSGVYALSFEHGLDWAARGLMVVSINPQAIPNDRPREYYTALAEGPLRDYRTEGRHSRDTLSFVPMFLRAARAVDFVASLPDWDGTHLIAMGHSQGGGQALAAAALNSSITGLVTSCCTHCDHTGPAIGRVAGWPKIVEVRDGVPDPDQLEAVRYIDGVNLAHRVTCPTLFGVCFLDDLCPPTGIYAAWNALRGPKAVYHDIATGHVYTDAFAEASRRWVAEHVAAP